MAPTNDNMPIADFARLLDALVRLMDESVRVQAVALRQGFEEDQKGFILALAAAGFENARIAEFIGAKADTVRVTVNRARKASKQKGKTRG